MCIHTLFLLLAYQITYVDHGVGGDPTIIRQCDVNCEEDDTSGRIRVKTTCCTSNLCNADLDGGKYLYAGPKYLRRFRKRTYAGTNTYKRQARNDVITFYGRLMFCQIWQSSLGTRMGMTSTW